MLKFKCMLTLKVVLVLGLCLRCSPVLAREKKSLEFGLESEFELKIKLAFELDFELVLKRQIVVSVV